MRIIHVIDYFQPELGYQETFLAREQQRIGHEVIVVTSNQPGRARQGLESLASGSAPYRLGRATEHGLEVIRLPARWGVAGRLWLSRLEQTVRGLEPDATHSHGFATMTTLRLVLQNAIQCLPGSLVIDDHMYPGVSKRKTLGHLLYPWIRAFHSPLARRFADAIVAVSPSTLEFMTEHYGLSSRDVMIIPLAADTRRFRFDPKARNEIRSSLSVPPGGFVIMYTGKMVAYKQIDVLVDAFLNLAADYDHLYLMLVGSQDKAYVRSIKEKIASVPGAPRIHWLPAVPNLELSRYLSAADVAVWPAGHTISVLEAMACGLPVIVSDDARAADELRHDNGLVFPKGCVSELVRALRSLIGNPTECRSMGQNGLQAVKDCYNWETVTRKFLDLYRGNGACVH